MNAAADAVPMDAGTGELLALAVAAARRAGELLRERFGTDATGVDTKSTRTDLVSDADRDAEALIFELLQSGRPTDEIVGEEGAATTGTSGVRWLVDPLDGTVNYLWGHPQWSVSIAAADDDGDLVAAVFDPCRDELFTMARGRGATLNGRPLRLAPGLDLGEALVGTGFAYRSDERARQAAALAGIVPRVRDIRRAGSAALDLAWVAAGRLDAFFETTLNPWDWAGGSALVRAAGGEAAVHRRPDLPDLFVATRPGAYDAFLALVTAAGA